MKEKADKEITGRALASYDRMWDNIPRTEGRCFLLSSQAYQTSLTYPSSNSLYTKYLIEGLQYQVESIELWISGLIESGGALKLVVSAMGEGGIRDVLKPQIPTRRS